MKPLAIIALILCLAGFAAVGYYYTSCNITVEAVGATATAAQDQQAYFEMLQRQVERGEVIGTRFEGSLDGEAADYQFLSYGIRLKNTCFVAADNVEVQVTPMDGDVLQIGDSKVRTLAAGTTGDISATILTTAGSQPVRELTVTYYIWGIPFSLRTMYRTAGT